MYCTYTQVPKFVWSTEKFSKKANNKALTNSCRSLLFWRIAAFFSSVSLAIRDFAREMRKLQKLRIHTANKTKINQKTIQGEERCTTIMPKS